MSKPRHRHVADAHHTLITRGNHHLDLEDEIDIFFDPRGRDLVLETLYKEFALQYTGALPK